MQPPTLPDGRASTNDADNFSQAGFRVPTVLASPYAQPGFVDHALYDHTSILRFIEWRFLGAPAHGPGGSADKWFLTARDRNANNIGDSLVRTKPDPEIGFDLDVKIDPPDAPCPTADAPVALRNVPVGPFEEALHLGYYDRIGYTI